MGIALNTIALFLNRNDGPHGWIAVFKAALQIGSVACFVVAFTRLWRARRRRLLSLADDDSSAESPSQ
ncbi:MAG TPA: hypothetical protein VI357_19665 [Mycobacteriales bacterium]